MQGSACVPFSHMILQRVQELERELRDVKEQTRQATCIEKVALRVTSAHKFVFDWAKMTDPHLKVWDRMHLWCIDNNRGTEEMRANRHTFFTEVTLEHLYPMSVQFVIDMYAEMLTHVRQKLSSAQKTNAAEKSEYNTIKSAYQVLVKDMEMLRRRNIELEKQMAHAKPQIQNLLETLEAQQTVLGKRQRQVGGLLQSICEMNDERRAIRPLLQTLNKKARTEEEAEMFQQVMRIGILKDIPQELQVFDDDVPEPDKNLFRKNK